MNQEQLKKLIRNSIKQFIETWYLHFLSWICGPKYLRIKYQREFLHSSAGKESAHNVGDLGSIPGLGRYPGKGKGYSLQYSGLENSMDYIVHGVTKSQSDKTKWLSCSLSLFKALKYYFSTFSWTWYDEK